MLTSFQPKILFSISMYYGIFHNILSQLGCNLVYIEVAGNFATEKSNVMLQSSKWQYARQRSLNVSDRAQNRENTL